MRSNIPTRSNYAVGAAALVDDGRVVTGANIENASYGVTLCAECLLVSALYMSGGGKLAASYAWMPTVMCSCRAVDAANCSMNTAHRTWNR